MAALIKKKILIVFLIKRSVCMASKEKRGETKVEEVLIHQSALMQLGFVMKEQRCDGYVGLVSVCEY